MDPDVCLNGDEQPAACGLNLRGSHERTCSAGQWGAYTTCVDPDECIDTAVGTIKCGSAKGTRSRTCLLGAWGAYGECSTCVDVDGDDYGKDCVAGADCNDSDANVNPAASEVSFDGIDNDCDAATGFDLQYEANIGNPSYQFVALSGARLFASQGNRLYELDADDVAAGPVTTMTLEGDISQLQVVGDVLYVGLSMWGVQRYDVSGSVKYLDGMKWGFHDNPGFAFDGTNLLLCSVSDTSYYVQRATVGASGITAFGGTISGGVAGVLLGTRCEAALLGNKAAVGSAGGYFHFDASFSNLAGLTQTGAYQSAGLPLAPISGGWVNAFGATHVLYREIAGNPAATSVYYNGAVQGAVHVEDDRIYLGRNTGATACVSVANVSAAPITGAVVSCSTVGATISDIDVDGARVAVAHANGLTVFSRSDLALTKLSETQPGLILGPSKALATRLRELDIDQDLLLRATPSGVQFLRVGALGIPTFVSQLAYDGVLMDYYIEDGILYLAGFGFGANRGELITMDLHSGPKPVQLGKVEFGPSNSVPANAVLVRFGQRVVVAWAGTWYYFDVTDLANPVDDGTAAGGWVYGFGRFGSEVFASASDASVQRYDLSVPQTPKLLGSLPVSAETFDIQNGLLLSDDGDVLDLLTGTTLLPNNDGGGRQSSLDQSVGWAADQNGLYFVSLADLDAVTRTRMPRWRFETRAAVSYDDYLYVAYRDELVIYSGVNALR